jgi:hypothetical protein
MLTWFTALFPLKTRAIVLFCFHDMFRQHIVIVLHFIPIMVTFCERQVAKASCSSIQHAYDEQKYPSCDLFSNFPPPEVQFRNHHSYLIRKLTNWKILVVFYLVIEVFCDIVCDIIILDLRVEPTFVPQQGMISLQPQSHIFNTNEIHLMLLVHLTHVCTCYRVQVFLIRKLFDVVLHKMSETLPPLSMREQFMHCCREAFASI